MERESRERKGRDILFGGRRKSKALLEGSEASTARSSVKGR
jgi:hypothetical protein